MMAIAAAAYLAKVTGMGEATIAGRKVPIIRDPAKQGCRERRLLKRCILPPFETCCFFNTKIKGHLHLQDNVQVYNVRIPEKLGPPGSCPFSPLFWLGGFPHESRLQKKGYPYSNSNLSTGGPRKDGFFFAPQKWLVDMNPHLNDVHQKGP